MDDHPVVAFDGGETRIAHGDQIHFIAERCQLHGKGLCDLSAPAPNWRELVARHQ